MCNFSSSSVRKYSFWIAILSCYRGFWAWGGGGWGVSDISFLKICGLMGWQWSCDGLWSCTVGPGFLVAERMDVFQEVLAYLKRSGFNMKEIISLVLADDG